MTPKPISSNKFFGLVRGRNSRNAAKLDALINKACAAELTVVSCDSSGFSKKTHEHGIIEFMDNMVKCHGALEKIVARHGGTTLSNKADNLMLIFDGPAQAVACGIEMHRWLKKRNKGLPEYKRYNICVGIHHGSLLRFTDDAYGPAGERGLQTGRGYSRQGRTAGHRAGQRDDKGPVPHGLFQARHHRRPDLRRLQGEIPLRAACPGLKRNAPRKRGVLFLP